MVLGTLGFLKCQHVFINQMHGIIAHLGLAKTGITQVLLMVYIGVASEAVLAEITVDNLGQFRPVRLGLLKMDNEGVPIQEFPEAECPLINRKSFHQPKQYL